MLVVVNLRSNAGRAAARWPQAREAVLRARPDAQIVVPSNEQEAREAVAAACAQGHDAVVAAGGDGTANMVLNALMDPQTDAPRAPGVALGGVGLGSSNDFHKPFAPGAVKRAPMRIDAAGARPVDVGKAVARLEDGSSVVRYFLLNASLGLVADGNAAFNAGRGIVGWLKSRNVDLAIAACAVGAVAARRLPDVQVTADDWVHDGPVSNVGVLKTAHFAGGMRYDTPVDPDDGQFVVNLWRAAGRAAITRLVLGLYRGVFLGSPLAVSRRAAAVELRPSRPCPVELDGEILWAASVRLEVLPRSLNLCGQ